MVECPSGDDVGEGAGESVLDGADLELVARGRLEVVQHDAQVLDDHRHGAPGGGGPRRRRRRLVVDVVVAVVDDAAAVDAAAAAAAAAVVVVVVAVQGGVGPLQRHGGRRQRPGAQSTGSRTRHHELTAVCRHAHALTRGRTDRALALTTRQTTSEIAV